MTSRLTGSTVVERLVDYRILLIFMAIFAFMSTRVDGYFSTLTARTVLDQSSIYGLMAVGMTVCLIAAQVDLSIGSTLALSGIVTVTLQSALSPWGAFVAGVLTGTLVGIANGILVVRARINSIVTTLATMVFVRSVAHVLSGSNPVSGIDPDFGTWVDATVLPGLSIKALIFLILVAATFIFLSFSAAGRNLFAVGGNEQAARASGIPTGRYVAGSLVFSGTMAGLAGAILGLSLNTGSPILGTQTVVLVIAATVIGGTSLMGGYGGALRTLCGVLTLAVLTTGMNLQSVPAHIQAIVTGAILILVVLSDRLIAGSRQRLALWKRA